jgi:hypothetical protein
MGQIETGNPPDTQSLLAELRRYGVGYLMSEIVEPTNRGFQFQPAEFVTALARSSDPRVHVTLISVLLLHPELASVVKGAIEARARLATSSPPSSSLLWRARRSISNGHGKYSCP